MQAVKVERKKRVTKQNKREGESIMNFQTKEDQKAGVLNNPKEEKEYSSTEKINKALKLLDEVAKEKKEELNQLIIEKYSNIKDMMNEATESYKEVVEKTKQNLNEVMTSGEEKAKEI